MNLKLEKLLTAGFAAAALISGCAVTQSRPIALTDNQINYVATSRCLYKEGVLTREQLERRMERDYSNDPDGFMRPIIESSKQGITEEQNERVKQAIETTDCQNRVLAWAAVELPPSEVTEFIMLYMAGRDSK